MWDFKSNWDNLVPQFRIPWLFVPILRSKFPLQGFHYVVEPPIVHIFESLVMSLSLPACVKFEPRSCPKNLVSREIPSSRMRKVTRVFVQSQSFNPLNSIVHRIRRAEFAREFCFCRNFRKYRQANWGFAATRLEFQLQQPRRFRLWRVAENGNSQLDTFVQHVFAVRGHKVYAKVLNSTVTPSHLAVRLHYQNVAVRTPLVQPCTYAPHTRRSM